VSQEAVEAASLASQLASSRYRLSQLRLSPNNDSRVRHVKCDEQKPACSRCLKSGRQCDGYSIDGRRPNQYPLQIVHWQPNTLALHRISIDVAGNKEERRAFHFFRENSAADFPGFFESSFWGQLVLQASQAEPSIRHAVIALGSLHETVQQEEWTLLKSGRACDPFALQQCNKAIGHLNQNIYSYGQHSKEMLLMSCAIFICFESLQGNYESALSHMQSGLRIFRDWQAEASKLSPPGTASSSQHHQSVDSEIVQMFSRLNVQTLLFPDTHLLPTDFVKQDARLIIDSVPGAFTTLKEARDCLDNCMSYKLQASVAAYFNRQGSENDSGPGQPQDSTNEHLLPQWSAAFDAFVEKAGPSLTPKNLQGAMLLEIQYKCAKILLSVGMPPRETGFDDFGALFESIISLATTVIHRSGSCGISERAGHFSFETGLVPPLYFTATRCRDPWIRRQALSLLSSTPRQECIWNSEMLSKIAERLILIEEERDDIGQVTRSEVILVASRLSVLNATIYSEKGQVLVECCQHKCGPDGEMYLRDEWIMY
jgi:Fungal specific transcription factor domain/Fungal Zn(2)-Cys(6) binuclear cluster domain